MLLFSLQRIYAIPEIPDVEVEVVENNNEWYVCAFRFKSYNDALNFCDGIVKFTGGINRSRLVVSLVVETIDEKVEVKLGKEGDQRLSECLFRFFNRISFDQELTSKEREGAEDYQINAILKRLENQQTAQEASPALPSNLNEETPLQGEKEVHSCCFPCM